MQVSTRPSTLLFGAFVALVVLAPLFFGGNRPAPWSVLALVTGALLLGWAAITALAPSRPAFAPDGLWLLVALFAVPPLWALMQMSTLTPDAWHNPVWQRAAGVLDAEVQGRITLDPAASATALMRLLTYGGVFWLALQLGRAPVRARRLVKATAAAGLAYAAYGLVPYALDIEAVLWLPKPRAGLDSVSGTFIYRNAYATYAGLGLLCAVSLILTTLFEDGRPVVDRLGPVLRRSGWRAVAAVCIAVALLLSQSRGGFLASALGLVVLLVLMAVGGAIPRRFVVASVSAVLVVGVGLFLLLGGETADRLAGVEAELANPEASAAQRLEAYGRILHALGDAPLTGTGCGTFADAFRLYQRTTLRGFWDHAHGTYLENAMELGLPAALALVAAIGGAAWVCAEGLRRRRDAMYPCLGLAATALVGSHAAVDFTPEMPGVAVTYAAILGTACAQSWSSRAEGETARYRRRRRSRRGRGTTGPRRGGRHAAGAGPRAA